ncbi:reverse transcriptase domain-containing protein [Tanacetum coccineum]
MSPITPNPKRQLPGQSREEGTGASTPEAHHQSPVSSEDSNKTDLLHLGFGREKREVCSIGWEEKNQARIHALIVTARVPQAKGTEVPARKHHHEGTSSRRTIRYSESEDSEGGHWKSKSKRYRTRMPSHVKTYDGSGDPEDHIKLFQSVAKTERWAMPTWCHMFNSTLTGNARVWFDKLPKESIDSYEDPRAAFRENYREQTKHIKDLVEIHHIKQRDRESMEDFIERYKEEVLDVEGVP